MTDNVNISYSFQTGQTAQPPVDDSLVAFSGCELVRVDDAMTLVINRQNGQQQLLAPGLVDALTYCTQFRTLDAHAAWLASNRPELQGNVAAARSTLQQLDQAGLLLRANDVCRRFSETAPAAAAPTRAFIITCDRPDAVERLLESLLRAGNLAGHDALFLVDDSRSTDNQAANREALARFNTRSAKEMHYLGEDAQRRLLDALVEALPEHAVGLRFLLDRSQWGDHKTYGRARTLCLLLSVGYRAIVMDDDILCEAILPPIRDNGIDFGGRARKAVFFENESAMQQSMERAGFDALSGHAALLGSPLGHAIAQLNGGTLQAGQLEGVNATLANVLNPEGRVLITQCGSWGDTGTTDAHWTLNLGEDSIARLITAPHGISDAIANRCNWLGSSRPNIVKMAFMSQMTGLDNSQLLPPYFTAFRGEDLLFGAMVEYMHHDGTALEFAWGVPHLPLDTRQALSLRDPIAARGGMALFARWLTERVDYDDASAPEQQLARVALEARRLSHRSNESLLYDYRVELARGHADQLQLLKSQYAMAQSLPSDTWRGYLERGINETQQALAAVHAPGELFKDKTTNDDEILGQFRAMATGFGQALEGWPAAREASVRVVEEMIGSGALRP